MTEEGGIHRLRDPQNRIVGMEQEDQNRELDLVNRIMNRLQLDDWRKLYFKFSLNPFKITQEVAFEISKETFQQAVENWQVAEKLLWGPSRELIGEVARRMWEFADRQSGLAFDLWLAAEKYVASMRVSATRAAGWPVAGDGTFTEFDQLLQAFPPEAYIHRIRELAQLMWEKADRPYWTSSVDFWLAAEKHVLALIGEAVSTETPYVKAAEAVANRFDAFSPARYLEDIERRAYFMWLNRGGSHGNALEDWVRAEEEALRQIAAGEQAAEPAGKNEPI